MLEIEVALTGILALLGLHIILFWHYARNLIGVLDEIAFPSDDPIMTSTLVDDEVFEYEEEKEEKKNTDLDGFAEMDESTVAEPEALEVFDYAEETKEVSPEPEIFTEGLEPRRSNIPFLQPDFPPVTLAQLKRLSKAELVDLCEKYEKETDGTKADLVKRLID